MKNLIHLVLGRLDSPIPLSKNVVESHFISSLAFFKNAFNAMHKVLEWNFYDEIMLLKRLKKNEYDMIIENKQSI